MTTGLASKRLGNQIEELYAKLFIQLGFTFCKMTRLASKLHDNAKIDLMFIPFNIQIKGGKQRNLNAGKELQSMDSSIKLMFPPKDEVFSKPLILIHHEESLEDLGVPMKLRKIPANQNVFMSLTQFNKFKAQNAELKYDTIKEWKFDTSSEFKTIVHMTFEVFKKEIIQKLYM